MRRDHKATKIGSETFSSPGPSAPKDTLVIEGLKQNNLKNINVTLPHDAVTVVCGLSGSGKSSFAFDTLFAEGRWRFMESLSTYTRLFLERMDRPNVDKIYNIRPAIAIEQKNPVRTSRSTVGTATEINDHLRLLYARVGSLHCVECGARVEASTPQSAVRKLFSSYAGKKASVGFSLDLSGKDDASVSGILAGLVKKGFVRIKTEEGFIDIGDGVITLPKGELRVVADRVTIKDEFRSRVAEAMELSFREGGASAWAEVYDGDKTRSFAFSRALQCSSCGALAEKPTPILFSFNHPVGACQECKGFGNLLTYDEDRIVPDKNLTLAEGAVDPWTKPSYKWWHDEFMKYASDYGIDTDKKYSRLTKKEKAVLFDGGKDFDGINGFFSYLETKKYKLHIRVFLSRYKGMNVCPSCGGARLKKKALAVRLNGLNMAELSALTIEEAQQFFRELPLTREEAEIAKEPLRLVRGKLDFLISTGLGYMTLERQVRTLSGGEAQRVQLANQLASALSGVLYILDEPSIGLHARDVDMLSEEIKKLAKMKNTVVLVEHDKSMMSIADNVVELGPGAGEMGGRLVYSGSSEDFLLSASTLTSQYLTGVKDIPVPMWRRKGKGGFITLTGARGNNLKGVDLSVPLQTLTCVTGVSGSGKSTLIVDTLYNAIMQKFSPKTADKALSFDKLDGAALITGVKLIDQDPIGKTPRSNPVTYIGAFDDIRHIYATLKFSEASGLSAGSFSFNVPGGRCEKCSGEGLEKLEMYFLPDVYITCASCGGKRYKTQVLEVRLNGRNINDVLNMTFDEALRFFKGHKHLTQKLTSVKDVGLGYLRLGQSATTLSGGEAQRLKIARELRPRDVEDGGELYILDEPTTGLHPDDVKTLLQVLGKLVDCGNTVLVIEHNLDLIKTADHIIDLGPEGGGLGGSIVATGQPEDVARVLASHTGRYLKKILGKEMP